MAEERVDYPDYPVFKGLQKPLEFLGLRGRYIYWAAATVGGGLLSFLIGYIVFGFLVGLVLTSLKEVTYRHFHFCPFFPILMYFFM